MNLKSWGLYPKIKSKVFPLINKTQLSKLLSSNKEFIPYGNGKSYGDSALNENIIHTKKYNFFLNFNEGTGLLHVQSGVTLDEVIEVFLPRGWFIKITPGTKLITVGGAISADIHGKNHHIDGCFSQSVEEFTLMLGNGEIKTIKKNDELFYATCGGMGLTGVILDAKIYLKKVNSKYINQTTIKTKNLKHTFEVFEKYQDLPYSVAWIDCLSRDIGKAIVMVGDFRDDNNLDYKKDKNLNIPFMFPTFVLNKFSVKLFNYLYYKKAPKRIEEKKVSIDSFFYPLDKINNWNRIYGKNGFTQYQFILPKESSFQGLQEILSKIASSGKGSFLAVLKLYGKENKNYLSFPIAGYSLALDFKIEKGVFELLDTLDEIVLKHGGRMYLAKDARMSKETLHKSYPKIKEFLNIRKKYNLTDKFNSLQSKRLDI
ncbi:MAG: FAD-linked oxidase [uncultured Campylobacterales bacterium]|uniref:FAD-linked oxidase n=1 Tax=uncultured Campylobacterales bacterium TaxID=352960 RepID=A0A6S6SGS4_9BACT|nr:MAG: FAD-linked oxidase [uncultured Campylobacterales bacterium]